MKFCFCEALDDIDAHSQAIQKEFDDRIIVEFVFQVRNTK